MNSFRNRLDALATTATKGLSLDDPARRAPARRARSLMPGLAIGAVCLVIAAVAWVQFSGDGTSDVLVVGDGSEPVTSQPAGGPCGLATTLGLLQSGLPTYDYEPAGSYAEVAALFPDVVFGRVLSAQRTTVNGTSYTELTVDGVTDLDGLERPDVDVVAYQAVWADRSTPDPLAAPVGLDETHFFAFLTPWSGVRGGWNPGVEGLYVACGDRGPLAAVIADGRGTTDPQSSTISELETLLGAGPPAVTAPDPTTDATQDTEADARQDNEAEAAAQREREAEAAVDLNAMMAIRDALVQFGRGESLAIEEIPLADEVSIGLGSAIFRIESKDAMRDAAVWRVDEPEGYAGFAGPFSALDTLAAAPATQIVIGEHPNCAASPISAPTGFEHYLQVSIQPAEDTIDSCITWFSVDLFFDVNTLAIAAVTLSLFGP